MNHDLILTDDNSHTLYVKAFEESYHSTHGAIQESRHIFIESGLRSCPYEEIKLLEIGFGTGLNAFMALLEAEQMKKTIHYTALEYYPITTQQAKLLNYPTLLDASREALFLQLHQVPWEESIAITPYFHLTKRVIDFVICKTLPTYNVCFFDAFSPDKQPNMWLQDRFDLLYQYGLDQALLTTYCSKGSVRRTMQSAGFLVERLPGPIGKREILRGRKQL